jgi:FtsH ternary system domain X5
MSRSYRISVRESVNKVIKADDCVSTELEILEVLPPEQMADLLAGALEEQGFEKEGEVLVRREDGVTITVDPCSGKVTISAESEETTKIEQERHGRAYDDVGPHAGQVREQLRQEAQRDIEKTIQEKTQQLQGKVTDKLEEKLGELSQELGRVVNKVTAEALKQKAASLGQIKEITEDPQSGSMTIVVEV